MITTLRDFQEGDTLHRCVSHFKNVLLYAILSSLICEDIDKNSDMFIDSIIFINDLEDLIVD